tara:strand:- start:26 stop:1831 length:1806 start_codon:yes stop_codon:yes gene_type:complete
MSISRVQFIKISRLDQNGVDQSDTLNEMSQITIPYTVSGNQVYIILSRSAYPTYFLFTVDLEDPRTSTLLTAPSSQNSSLNYLFEGPLSDTIFSIPFYQGGPTFARDTIKIIPFTANTTTQTGPNLVNEQFYNSEEGIYTIGTQTRQSILIFSIPNFLVKKSGGTMSGIIGLFKMNSERTTFVPIKTYSVPPTNGDYVFPSSVTPFTGVGSINPGDSIVFGAYANGANATPIYRVVDNNTDQLPITISISNNGFTDIGPNVSPILEPYLTKPFEGSDCEVLLNNVDEYADNPFLQDIDFGTGIIPTNAGPIAAGTAAKGKAPQSRYTFNNILNPDHTSINTQPFLVRPFGPEFNPGSTNLPVFGSYEGASFYNQRILSTLSNVPLLPNVGTAPFPNSVPPINELQEQYSGATYTGYFSNYRIFSFNYNGNIGYITSFEMKYIISNEGEALALTPDSGSVDFMDRLYGSNANPLQGTLLGTPPGTVPRYLYDTGISSSTSYPQPRTSAIFFTTSGSLENPPGLNDGGDDGLQFYGACLSKVYGDGILLQVISTGSSAQNYPTRGFSGCVFPNSIELTTAKSLPGRTLQILADNNIIVPNSQN